MKVKINVTAQRYENYNVDANGFGEVPYWKPKGGMQFVIEDIDVDIVMYADNDKVVEAIQHQLNEQSSIAEKFEYLDHDVIFSEAKIAGVDFSESLSQLMNL